MTAPLANRRAVLRALSRLGGGAVAATFSVDPAGWLAGGTAQAQVLLDLDVPFVTTPDNVVLTMLELAQVKPSDYVMDLGSGDGRIVITAALRLGVRGGMGVEIDPSLVVQSNRNAQAAGVADRVKFFQQDLFSTDLAPADVITMYLLPDVNIKLRPKLLGLKPGVRLVSHDWDMGDWQPDRDVEIPAPQKRLGLRKVARLMEWTVPANTAGRYRTTGSATDFDLVIEQRYQMVSGGRLQLAGRPYYLGPQKIDGATVELLARDGEGRPARLTTRFASARPAEVTWQVSVEGQPSRDVPTVFTASDG